MQVLALILSNTYDTPHGTSNHTHTQNNHTTKSYIDVWLGGAIDLQDRFNLSGPAYRAGSGGKCVFFGLALACTFQRR
jgi:hypothetical protein